MRKRAMPSKVASDKKLTGHINEEHFAALIDGEVIPGRGKINVIDSQGNAYFLKSAKSAQVFMYRRTRFLRNMEFQKIGNVASLIMAFIDVFPETLADYRADKVATKRLLQESMRAKGGNVQTDYLFTIFIKRTF